MYVVMRNNPVSKHYISYNHTIEDYVICASAVYKETDKNRRLRLEEAWMILLDTLNKPQRIELQVVAIKEKPREAG